MKLENLTFKGGVHVPHYKELTQGIPLKSAKEPEMVIIPLQQHIGAPCDPLVKVGDRVKVGQKIGQAKAFVSAPVHSSIAGIVKKIAPMTTPTGMNINCITIESDGTNELDESVKPKGTLESLSSKEVLEIIKESGITGMGGAGFPTHVKLSPPPEKKIDTIILNGAECEPYLTADHRLMLERPEMVVLGLKAIMKAVEVDRGFIAIEDNKPDAIDSMRKACAGETNIKLVTLKAKFPQGDEKRIINAVTGREVPSGGLPMDVGVVVDNVGTANAIAEAIKFGKPLYERIVTVTGKGIMEPQNLIVKIGTSFNEVIEQCGGYKGTPGKLIMGGPMMGLSQFTDEIPVIKGTSGILILTEEEVKPQPVAPCIKCGKCVQVCPVHLQPLYISKFSLNKKYDKAEESRALDCIECGSCSFICPAKRPLVESIRVAKREIIAKRKKAK
ncbi:electron transport complex subunit RsxC [Anaerosalibacter sp. Marseille-P3206]|uniref:electron transport complex subunit RsxC n=1 Tax=Anaerosalibacter sp. Marseille-P3206 TaxID=1871005 RepID=UPI000984186A|nr:electron transport complex subunit RsxC [Anaerosalibacter sp. Marseille-P3206]